MKIVVFKNKSLLKIIQFHHLMFEYLHIMQKKRLITLLLQNVLLVKYLIDIIYAFNLTNH